MGRASKKGRRRAAARAEQSRAAAGRAERSKEQRQLRAPVELEQTNGLCSLKEGKEAEHKEDKQPIMTKREGPVGIIRSPLASSLTSSFPPNPAVPCPALPYWRQSWVLPLLAFAELGRYIPPCGEYSFQIYHHAESILFLSEGGALRAG